MIWRRRPRSTPPKTKPPGKVQPQHAPDTDTRMARKDARVTALQSKGGADRAQQAYNELAHTHDDELETIYQQHRSDQDLLRNALMKLCGKHRVSYAKLHYAFTHGAGGSHDPPGSRPAVEAPRGSSTPPLISLHATGWDAPVTLYALQG